MCIPEDRVCDGFANCPNFEDEGDCECGLDEFRCIDSGLCIAGDLRCNFEPDCRDASDEIGCGTHF